MLRKLERKDAPRMLEWMQDAAVLQGLQERKFSDKTLADCEAFIASCADESENCHRAIVDASNRYLGTVSLKGIDPAQGDAEFAIVLRRDAQGHGYAYRAMQGILRIAFEAYALNEVYWNVLRCNAPAIRLYEHSGARRMAQVSERRLAHAPKRADGTPEEAVFYHLTRDMWLATPGRDA